MASAQRIAVIVLATVLGGMTAAVAVIGSESLETGLSVAAAAALNDAGVRGVDLRFEGREALLSATGADAAELAEAARVVERVDGVRWVTVARSAAAGAPDPTPSPTVSDPGREPAIAELERTEIRFAPDSAALDRTALRAVVRVAVLLTEHPDLAVRLTGQVAIATGSAHDALAFSERRAQAVVDELVAAGVEATRLEIAGAGAAGVDAADNRRVSIEIVESR